VLLKDIHILIGLAAMFLAAAAAVWGTIRFAIPNLRDGIGHLSVKMQTLEGNSMTTSQFKTEFERLESQFQDHKITCQRIVCGRIDEIKVDLRDMDKRRETARKEMVPLHDFDVYKDSMQRHVVSISTKLDRQSDLLSRLDERVLTLLKANGNHKSARRINGR